MLATLWPEVLAELENLSFVVFHRRASQAQYASITGLITSSSVSKLVIPGDEAGRT